jgi:hypothetical protein
MRKWSAAALALSLSFVVSALVLAQGQAPPPGWGKPKALPPANGQGQVTFQHAGTPMTLPLQEIEIQAHSSGMYIVTVKYVDPRQENELLLSFGSMPKLGAKDPKMINSFVVKTKAHGLSRCAASKTTCNLTIATLTPQAVSGTVSCSGMTDMSAEKPAPAVTGVKFDGKVNAK